MQQTKLEQFTSQKHGGDSECGPFPPEFRTAIEMMSVLEEEDLCTHVFMQQVDGLAHEELCFP